MQRQVVDMLGHLGGGMKGRTALGAVGVAGKASAGKGVKMKMSEQELRDADAAHRGAKMATFMLFPWEKRQLDGGELTYTERLYWAVMLPTFVGLIGYTLYTNKWEDLRQGRLTPSIEEQARMQAREQRVQEESKKRFYPMTMPSTEPEAADRRTGDTKNTGLVLARQRLQESSVTGAGENDNDDCFDGLDPAEIDRLVLEQQSKQSTKKA